MKNISFACILLLFVASSCRKEDNKYTEDIPDVPVNLIINMELPSYMDLQHPGRWMYFDGGSRGIIVYHGYDNEFYAYDRNCPWEPFKACSTLEVEGNNLYTRCGQTVSDTTFTQCCTSRFELSSGFPVNGPANRAMKMYFVNKQGNTLSVGN